MNTFLNIQQEKPSLTFLEAWSKIDNIKRLPLMKRIYQRELMEQFRAYFYQDEAKKKFARSRWNRQTLEKAIYWDTNLYF